MNPYGVFITLTDKYKLIWNCKTNAHCTLSAHLNWIRIYFTTYNCNQLSEYATLFQRVSLWCCISYKFSVLLMVQINANIMCRIRPAQSIRIYKYISWAELELKFELNENSIKLISGEEKTSKFYVLMRSNQTVCYMTL